MSVSSVSLTACATCGELLRFLRRRARLSQRELAIAVGYSESHISRIENNERPVDRTSLLALFVPTLHLQNEPALVNRLLALCTMPPAKPASEPITSDAALPAPVVHHLPLPFTSFIGRQEEVSEVSALLQQQQTRLLTLTGIGGGGKTRLALHVGAQLAQHYDHGVWLVELASLADPQLLPKTVATVFGLNKVTDDAPLANLTAYLHARRTLLILDNCEHLVEAVAHLAATLLQTCPHLQILATSREALAVPGEINYRIQPLALPPSQHKVPPLCAEVAHYDAIQLFVARAQEALRTFTLTDQNAPAVTQICQRLDGIPLGIELAAAWVYLLSPVQIASRLAQDFDLLVGSGRLVLPRHQTLHAAMDWSYRLLTEPERILLRRLAVFTGGWHLAAAEAVVADDDNPQRLLAGKQVLKLLNQVVNKSLVVVEHSPEGEAYYRLLEPLRAYLKGKLTEAKEEATTYSRYLHYFLSLAEQLAAQTRSSTQAAALATFDREQDNLRAALAWGLAPQQAATGAALVAAALAVRLGRYWYMRQHWYEGCSWLAKALALFTDDLQPPLPTPLSTWRDSRALYAALLFQMGYLAGGQGDLPTAQACLAQSLALQRTLGDQRGLVRCLQELGGVASEQGDYGHATALLAESLSYSRVLGDDWLLAVSVGKLADVAGEQNDYGRCAQFAGEYLTIARRLGDIGMLITALNLLAQCAVATARYAQAVALLEEAIALNQQGNPNSTGSPWALRNLALARQMLGDYAQAAADYRQSLRLRWERQQPTGMAWALEGLGETLALSGDLEQAARLWGAAHMLRRRVASVMSSSDQARHQPIVDTTCAQLGAERFKAAWVDGEAMTPEQVVAYALTMGPQSVVLSPEGL